MPKAIALALTTLVLQFAVLVAPPIGPTHTAPPSAAPRSVAAQPAPGAPLGPIAPIAYGFSATFGQTGVPWQRGSAQLNQPWGVGGEREGVWIANGAGRNVVRFGAGAIEELGRAGTLDALAGRPVRFVSDVAVAVHEVVPPGTSWLPRRTVWLVDEGGHTAFGVPIDNFGVPSAPLTIGHADVSGDDDTKLREPTGIAADDDVVYVSDTGNHRVQVFSSTGDHLATIGQTGVPGLGPDQLNQPARLAIGHDGRLYVADAGNHRVVAYDVTDPRAPSAVQFYGTAGVPGSGRDAFDTPLGVYSDGTFLYVADSANGRVQVLRWRTGEYWRTLDGDSIDGCGSPGGRWGLVSDVTQDAGGNIYVTRPDHMRVEACDAARRTYRPELSNGISGVPYITRGDLHNAPFGVAAAADGTVAVVEGEGHRVVARRADGGVEWVAGRAGVAGADVGAGGGAAGTAGDAIRFDRPTAAAYLPDGRLVVADAGNGRLVVLDNLGRLDAVWGVGELDEPVALAVLADGSLAVADVAAGLVRLVDAAGAVTGELSGPGGALVFDEPSGVAVGVAGTWYVVERSLHVVRVLSPAGRVTRTLGEVGMAGDDFGHFDHPSGLAVDGDGRLFVADTGNHRVQVFGADGSYLTTVGGRRGDGTGGFVEPRSVAVAPDGRVLVADAFNHRVQVFDRVIGPWRPEAVNGFGARDTQAVEALAELDGLLYAGIRAVGGASIVRRDGDGPWTAVVAGGRGRPADQAVVALSVYDDQLYAGIENVTGAFDAAAGVSTESSAGGAVWRSGDGASWETVATGGLGDADQSAIGPFETFDGHLYAGTRSIDRDAPPKLWRSASGDAGSWERVRIDLSTIGEWPRNGGISALAVYSDTLYVGTCADDMAQVYRSADGAIWRPAAQLEPGGDERFALPQLGSGAPCITDFADYDGHLYAALGTDARMGARLGVHVDPKAFLWGGRRSPAVELWRCGLCDGTDWEPASAPGFGDAENRGAMGLAVFEEPPFRYLYAFAGSPKSGLAVWRAWDGLDWQEVAPGGFGDDNNHGLGSGTAALVYRNRLHIGTANAANGGEVWSSGGTRPEAIPTRSAPAATPTATPRSSPEPLTGRAQYRQVDAWPLMASSPPDKPGAPIDLALAADGTVFILDRAPNRVLRLLPDDTWGAPFGGSGSERITQAGAIAWDEAAGRLYVADRGTERLLAYNRLGMFQRSVLSRANIVDIAVQPDGSLWVADIRAGAVRRIDYSGTELERFGRYSVADDDGFEGLVAVDQEPSGRLWVADENGARLRAYQRDAAGGWLLQRTLDLSDAALAGCDGRRLQVLRDDVLLAGRCILRDGTRIDLFPPDHRGSDLYGTGLHTALPSAGLYVALATYDVDRVDPANPELPAVVSYADEGFDIVTGFVLGGRETVGGAGAASAESLDGPFRLDVLPGGDVVVMDLVSRRDSTMNPGYFQRFTPDGRVVEALGVRSYPSRSSMLMMDADLTVATGEPGRVIGVAYLRRGNLGRPQEMEVVAHASSVKRRRCEGGACIWAMYADPVWDTTLVNLNLARGAPDYNYAATFEHSRRRYWLLQVWADKPDDMAMPARLFRFDVDGRGRKTAVHLDGTEREAMWTDVDAGPDGRVVVLDALNDRVQVLDADGNRLGQIETPKDAWKVAAGPNGEVFVLTHYGHVVRMAADGTILSRFNGLPNDLVPPTALTDLGVDAWGRVYTVDDLYDQVTVFEPEGTEDDVLEGDQCTLGGDKWVAPNEVLLGETAQLHMALFGTCGFVEDEADIVLMLNASYVRDSGNPSLFMEARRLRAARQIFSIIDLDRHRVGLGRYVTNGTIDQPLTQDRARLIRALYDVPTNRATCGGTNTLSALSTARDMFEDTPPGRRKLLVLIHPDKEPGPIKISPCWPPWNRLPVRRRAAELEAEGITIVSVNGWTAACSSATMCNIPVAQRGQGTGRRAVSVSVSRQWPPSLLETGTLVDELPANMEYVAGSAHPPAVWDAALRTLTWDLLDIPLGSTPGFSLTIRPREEGYWPTNVRAVAEVVDGWDQPQTVVFPIPYIRVYGERPPTPIFTPTITPTPAPTDTPEPTPTSQPGTIYLPIALRTEACEPDTQSADVALVIDTSGSMTEVTSPGGPTKLEAARDGARAFLSELSVGRDQATLIQFNTEATVLEPLTGDIAAVDTALDRLTQASGTRIDAALDAGRGELTGLGRRPENNAVLILLTDGEPTGTTREEVQAAAERAKADGLLVFTIGLGTSVDEPLLTAVASRPEWYFPSPDTSDLAAIYGQIAYAIPCRPMWP